MATLGDNCASHLMICFKRLQVMIGVKVIIC